jgi:tetratricopeptide (TPR) repeat protein
VTRPVQRCALAAAALGLAVLALYARTAAFGFVNYDDPQYVQGNGVVRQGLTLHGLAWAFSSGGHASNWHPLTWLSLMTDATFFGPGPGALHAVNALLHAGAAVLLLLLLFRVTGSPAASLAAAALWALHPLRVESVAWISQRKDVLSGFWGLAALLLWVWPLTQPAHGTPDDGRRERRRHLAAAAALALALMSKPTVVTFPVLAALLEHALTGRVRWRRLDAFVALSVCAAVMTFRAQHAGGAVVETAALPLPDRLLNACAAAGTYLAQTVLPEGLAPYYPLNLPLPADRVLAGGLAAGSLLAFAWVCIGSRAARARGPAFAAGPNAASIRPYGAAAAWFLAAMLPMAGIVQVGGQAHADRYTYWPGMGVALAVAWAMLQLERRFADRRAWLRTAAGLAAAGLALASFRQIGRWRDTETLFRWTLRVTDRNAVAHNNLGIHLCQTGRMAEGIGHIRQAAACDPGPRQLAELAIALAENGNVDEAAGLAERARNLNGIEPLAWHALGVVAYARGAYAEAARVLAEAVRLEPEGAGAWSSWGNALARQRQWPEAVAAWRRALELDPSLDAPRENLRRHADKGGGTTEKPHEDNHRRTFEETGIPVPGPESTLNNDKPPHPSMDIAVFAALCDEAVLSSGAELLFHAMPAAIDSDHGAWAVTLCTKTGLRKTRARVLVDATGDANAVQLAGFELVRPGLVQPATLQMRCSGYDPAALDFAALRQAAERAIAAGELKTTDVSWYNDGPASFLKRRGNNANHLRAPGADTSEGRTAAEVEARRAFLRMYRFFRRQPGLENFRVDTICTEAGIRETATIRGKTTITVQDYEAGRLYPDALCYAFYPVDEHLNDGQGINGRRLRGDVLPTIPRGALLPEGSEFLVRRLPDAMPRFTAALSGSLSRHHLPVPKSRRTAAVSRRYPVASAALVVGWRLGCGVEHGEPMGDPFGRAPNRARRAPWSARPWSRFGGRSLLRRHAPASRGAGKRRRAAALQSG